jgi:hypothetical protein
MVSLKLAIAVFNASLPGKDFRYEAEKRQHG